MIKKYSKPQKAKPLKYKDVIGNLKYPQTRLDQNLDQAIKNEEGLPYLQTPVLNTLRGKKQELARKQLQTECENNKSIKVFR